MNRRMKTGLTGILIAAFFIIIDTCATTTLDSVWRAESYQGKLNKVFVKGVIKSPEVKSFFKEYLNSYMYQ